MINLNIYLAGMALLGMIACQNTQTDTQKSTSKIDQSNTTQAKYTPSTNDKESIKEPMPTKPTEYILSIDSSSQVLPIKEYPHSKENLESILAAFQNKDTLKIICYGNSITNGYKVGSSGRVAQPYPETLEKLLKAHYQNPYIKVINQGHNGWRSAEALKNVQSLVINERPHLVILKFGINDVYSNLSPARFEQNMRQLIGKIKNENIKILLLLPTPIQTVYEEKVQQYAPVLQKITQDEKIAFFDLHTAMLQRADKENVVLGKLLPDNIHLNDPYYPWIAEEILHFLK